MAEPVGQYLVLKKFFDGREIYRTEHFRGKYEALARENLYRALKRYKTRQSG